MRGECGIGRRARAAGGARGDLSVGVRAFGRPRTADAPLSRRADAPERGPRGRRRGSPAREPTAYQSSDRCLASKVSKSASLPQSSPSFLTRSLNFFFAASDVPRGMRARHCFQSSAYLRRVGSRAAPAAPNDAGAARRPLGAGARGRGLLVAAVRRGHGRPGRGLVVAARGRRARLARRRRRGVVIRAHALGASAGVRSGRPRGGGPRGVGGRGGLQLLGGARRGVESWGV